MPVLFDEIQLQQPRLLAARVVTVLFALACCGAGSSAFAIEPAGAEQQTHVHAPQDHRHEHEKANLHDGADALAALQASGRQWVPDAPLQQGMARVHAALDGFERTAADAQAAAALGAETQAAVDQIFANCKLAPAADADLHVLLSELLAGTAALGEGRIVEGHERIKRAHAGYAAVFTALP